jgi:hypothetical protein
MPTFFVIEYNKCLKNDWIILSKYYATRPGFPIVDLRRRLDSCAFIRWGVTCTPAILNTRGEFRSVGLIVN